MIVIRPNVHFLLRHHGEETYPEESCGVLMGRFEGGTSIAMSAIPCANTRMDSLCDRYAIDPKDLIRIQREAREQGLDIVGFYHSHPDHPAEWSSTDIAEAHWWGCSYVITRVTQGLAAETRSFRLEGAGDEKHFVEEPIVEESGPEKGHRLS